MIEKRYTWDDEWQAIIDHDPPEPLQRALIDSLIADRLNAQAARIAELEEALSEVTDELEHMYANYRCGVRARDNAVDADTIRSARAVLKGNHHA